MKHSEHLADLVLSIPNQAKANPDWLGWGELQKKKLQVRSKILTHRQIMS